VVRRRLEPGPVRSVAVAWLREWSRNPREASDERFEDLKAGLAADPEMLQVRPLVALPDGTVIMGNHRLRAAIALGWTSVPVAVVDLDPERATAWALRDNNHYADWDEPALAELLAELASADVDLLLTGFATREIDRLLDGINQPIDPDDAPALPGTPESEPGELYELGPHRLLCADATDQAQVARLMAGAKAEVLLTDPPYGVEYEGKTKAALRIRNDTAAGLDALLKQAFAAVNPVLSPGARVYVFSPAGPLGTNFRLALDQAGWPLRQTLVWVKNSIVLGHSDYHYAHEDVLFAAKPGPGRVGRGRHPGSRWYGGNSESSVLYFNRPKRSDLHPTMKPIDLVARLLRNSSRRGDLILDPFAGSGTSLVACEQLGRRCYAIELDPRYVDVIRTRYQRYCNDH
jgi:DNA modification methylase